MAKIHFSTKAETLELLLGRLMSACVLPQVRLSVGDWSSRKSEIFSRLENLGWLGRRLIVRSSALVEDQKEQSLAGHFTSVLNVEGKNEVICAIEKVIKSFCDSNVKNQVFIQPMLERIALSGVAFTRNPSSGAPYIIINYDDRSGSTESVTSGKTNELKTYFCVKKVDITHPAPLDKVVSLLLELESIFENDAIDVEFAVTENGQVYLLQARPMSLTLMDQSLDEPFSRALEGIRNKVSLGMHPHPYLLGSRTVYGVMPDWNPAEIVGVRPRPFALSLYKEIITDAIWAYQRLCCVNN